MEKLIKISILEARKWAIQELVNQNIMSIEIAQENVDFLLTGALDMNYGTLHANMTRQIPEFLVESWARWISELITGRPVQYVLGTAPFYGREFLVDERVLIPRPETELLVDWVLQDLKANSQKEIKILDIGTGSGAIVETILLEDQRVQGMAADISTDALTVAQHNAKKFKIRDRISFTESDVFAQIPAMKFDVILSNPPYIDPQDQNEMDQSVIDFEPDIALYAAHQGLAIYENIAQQLNNYLKDDGIAYFEIGYKQGQAVKDLLRAYIPQAQIDLKQDLSKLDRMIRVKK